VAVVDFFGGPLSFVAVMVCGRHSIDYRVVSGNIRFMPIFEGVPWRGVSNGSEVID